jgi:hypothetical protein
MFDWLTLPLVEFVFNLLKDSPQLIEKTLQKLQFQKQYAEWRPTSILLIKEKKKKPNKFPHFTFSEYPQLWEHLCATSTEPQVHKAVSVDPSFSMVLSLLQNVPKDLRSVGWGYKFNLRRREYIAIREEIKYSRNLTVLVWLRASEPENDSYKNHRTIISEYDKPKDEYKNSKGERHFEFYVEGIPKAEDENGTAVNIQGAKNRAISDPLSQNPEHSQGEFKAYIPPFKHLQPQQNTHPSDFGSGITIDDNKNHFLAFTLTENAKDSPNGAIAFFDNCEYLDKERIWSNLNANDFSLREGKRHPISYPKKHEPSGDSIIFIGKQSHSAEQNLMYFDGTIYRIEIYYESLSQELIKERHIQFLKDFKQVKDSLFAEDYPFTHCNPRTYEKAKSQNP